MLKKFWPYIPDLKECWILVIILVIGGTALSTILTIIMQFAFPSLTEWYGTIAYPFIFLLPYFWIVRSIKKKQSNILLPLNSPNFGKMGGIIFFILLIPLLLSFNYVTEPLSSWMTVPDFIKKLFESVTENKISSLIMMVILAPLFEETFCRGIILRGLMKHMNPWKAIFWSALIFGVIHLNPWQAIPAFLVGSLMGWVYWKSGSLWATIFLHFINNGFSYLIAILLPELPADAGFKDLFPGNMYYIYYLLSLIILISILILINRNYDNTLSTKIQTNN